MRKTQDTYQLVKMLKKLQRLNEQELTRIEPIIREVMALGIPIIRREMAKNGSSEPRFEADDNYSYFVATLPITSGIPYPNHPQAGRKIRRLGKGTG